MAAALLMTRRRNRLLERRCSELELFAGRVAHDVQSPLSAVSLAVGLLHPPLRAGEEPRGSISDHQLAERALASLKRVHSIVEGLLDFARSGAAPDPSAQADLPEVLGGVLCELSGPAADAGIALDAPPCPPCRVSCAPGVLASLLSNLLRNAIQHMGQRPERRVAVRVQSGPRRVRVEVEDTGPGVPAGWEALIFEPYLRAPGGAHSGGVGLGLATVRRLVEAHAGTVGFQPAPGGGSRFWFELPRVAESRAALPPEEPAEPRAAII